MRRCFPESQNRDISALFQYISDQLETQDKAEPLKGIREMSKHSLREILESIMLNKIEVAIRAKVSPDTITRIELGLPQRTETKRKIIKSLKHINSDETKVTGAFIKDNGDNRLGLDRRQFSYDQHIPERRSNKDRRSKIDRRLKPI